MRRAWEALMHWFKRPRTDGADDAVAFLGREHRAEAMAAQNREAMRRLRAQAEARARAAILAYEADLITRQGGTDDDRHR